MQAVLVRRRQSSLGSCFCSMFGLEEGRSTRGLGSGKMSAPDHNNQFPCALLRTGFRFAFAQSAVLKGALFRKQRGQESQVRLTTITNHLVRCCRLSSGLILLNVVVQKGVVTETTRSGIASAPDLFYLLRGVCWSVDRFFARGFFQETLGPRVPGRTPQSYLFFLIFLGS